MSDRKLSADVTPPDVISGSAVKAFEALSSPRVGLDIRGGGEDEV